VPYALAFTTASIFAFSPVLSRSWLKLCARASRLISAIVGLLISDIMANQELIDFEKKEENSELNARKITMEE